MESGKEIIPLSYSEVFEKHCPYYMAIGMSYDDFWNGDCSLVRVYRQKAKLELSMQNRLLWMQGRYIYDAVGALTPVLHAFAKQGAKPHKYIEKPYPITEEELKAEEERRIAEQRKQFRESMIRLAEESAKKFKKGGDRP